MPRLPLLKQLNDSAEVSTSTEDDSAAIRTSKNDERLDSSGEASFSDKSSVAAKTIAAHSLIGDFAARTTAERDIEPRTRSRPQDEDNANLVQGLEAENTISASPGKRNYAEDSAGSDIAHEVPRPVQDFSDRIAEHQFIAAQKESESKSQGHRAGLPFERQAREPPTASIVQNAFDRMRPRRRSSEVATVTIGSTTTTSVFGSLIYGKRKANAVSATPSQDHTSRNNTTQQNFNDTMQTFAASGNNLVQTVGLPQSITRPSKPQFEDTSDEETSLHSSSSDEVLSSGIDSEEKSVAQVSGLELDGDVEETQSGQGSEDDYIDENEKKAIEEAKVAEMIKQAEDAAAQPSHDIGRRAQLALKGGSSRDSTTELIQKIDISIKNIGQQLQNLRKALQCHNVEDGPPPSTEHETPDRGSANSYDTDSHTLAISKSDFQAMQIIGQFNLGFILATRNNKDLFIIDQHASDEKINFERLQATTVIQTQRLVHPRQLELTAVDEEIVLEHQDLLLRNGFVVEVDQSGSTPVGQRCSLVSLPMSKEYTFTLSDLEELIALLADAPSNPSPSTSSTNSAIPRPTKIRKLLAMRACRSSIMIGKVMTGRQMQKLVGKMGEIDKPWNCPHGRPTMRHVCGLEGIGVFNEVEEGLGEGPDGEKIDWKGWIERREASGLRQDEGEQEREGEEEEEEEDEDDEEIEDAEDVGSEDDDVVGAREAVQGGETAERGLG